MPADSSEGKSVVLMYEPDPKITRFLNADTKNGLFTYKKGAASDNDYVFANLLYNPDLPSLTQRQPLDDTTLYFQSVFEDNNIYWVSIDFSQVQTPIYIDLDVPSYENQRKILRNSPAYPNPDFSMMSGVIHDLSESPAITQQTDAQINVLTDLYQRGFTGNGACYKLMSMDSKNAKSFLEREKAIQDFFYGGVNQERLLNSFPGILKRTVFMNCFMVFCIRKGNEKAFMHIMPIGDFDARFIEDFPVNIFIVSEPWTGATKTRFELVTTNVTTTRLPPKSTPMLQLNTLLAKARIDPDKNNSTRKFNDMAKILDTLKRENF